MPEWIWPKRKSEWASVVCRSDVMDGINDSKSIEIRPSCAWSFWLGIIILKTALDHGWTRMNTDKERLASTKALTQTVSPPK
jgi:hypothetical protein